MANDLTRISLGARTKKDVVTQALLEYVQLRKQFKILAMFGTLDFEDGFDAKVRRANRRAQLPEK